jgi:hypothetical protein
MRVRGISRDGERLPKDAAAPIVAFPLLVCHQLGGLTLNGEHGTGEDIDPDEVPALERLFLSAVTWHRSCAMCCPSQLRGTLGVRYLFAL